MGSHNDLHDFAPGILSIEDAPPSPLPRVVLRGVLLLILALSVWACFGRLDVVAVAEGKLVPKTYLKIVQPADAGIVREIAIKEGEVVTVGQVLVRMDTHVSEADSQTLQNQLQHKSLELRRIEAELANQAFVKQSGDADAMFKHIEAEYLADRTALEDALAQERANLDKAKQDLSANLEIQRKLVQTLPSYRKQEEAYTELSKDGYVGGMTALDKQRERIEKEQDLRTQEFNAQSLRASIAQSEKRLAQITSNYRQKLQADKVSTYADHQKLQQEWAKQEHKNRLLELRAPQAGVVKDLATHTPGTVVSPGTVLMTLVPGDEAMQAEVWLRNDDAGFVHAGQPVKLKLVAYPFQKYGMIDGTVRQVSADANDAPDKTKISTDGHTGEEGQKTAGQLAYRTLVELKTQVLPTEFEQLKLTPGMQLAAEIKLRDQTVVEYLLSPVRKAFHEAARER
jgi:hemolysin D